MKQIFIAIIAVSLIGCAQKSNGENETVSIIDENILQLTDQQLKSFPLTFTALQERIISNTLKLNGKANVPPQHVVSVSTALGGYVKSIKLLPGTYFRRGETLAVIEDNQYIQLQQDYLTAKAQLINAEIEYHRQKELNQSKASSDKIYQQASTDYQTLQITVNALKEKLKLIHIVPEQVSIGNIRSSVNISAPFDGYVSQVFVNTGKYVSPSEILFELINPTNLHLNLKVFEKDWDKISVGQAVRSYSNSNPEKVYNGKIILKGKSISNDRTVELHAQLENYGNHLIPGLYMNAEIDIPDNKALSIMNDCIVSFEGNNYVFVKANDNKFEMIEVKASSSGNGWTSIENHIALKDKQIVQQGAYTLLMALKNKAEEE